METSYHIRNLRSDEIDIPIEWARQEGWNPGIHDGEMHYPVDPEGWFCAEENGEIIGVAAGINYDESFSFGGFYIIRPDHRDHGVGWSLCQKLFAHVGDRNFGIDGVYAMQDKYATKAGMIFAYRNIRWQGVARGTQRPALVPASEVPFDDLLAFDTAHFPAERRRFLERWLSQPDGNALVHLDAQGQIAGYGVIRRCYEGHKIGPLFANTPAVADEILNGLLAPIPDETFFIDTPEPNSEAVRMARDRGMTEVFGTARMYSKRIPDLPIQEIFGVTTFELG